MASIFYGVISFISLVCTGIYIYIWHKHFDVNLTVIFILVPVSCLGYLLQARANSLEAMVTGIQVCYMGGCFLELFIVLCIFNLCQIEIKRWLRTILFGICTFIFVSTLTIGYTDSFYRSMSFEKVGETSIMVKEYGFMHTVFYVVLGMIFFSGIIAIIYSYLKKKQVPRIVILLLAIPDVICALSLGCAISPPSCSSRTVNSLTSL